ncbi:MAG: PHP domain-containing protein, partial [Duncaniella sp.]|nr:PHP domain-containing protein [Duncaniella sp.]
MSLNIKEIIAATRDYNFHSHTQFCDGREPMEAMAAAAVAEGLTHYGFTHHSPICVPSSC